MRKSERETNWRKHKATMATIWLNSDLYLSYLSYRLGDLITLHNWSCSSELCINFVVCKLCYDFEQSDSVYRRQISVIEDDESRYVDTFLFHLGHVVYLDKGVKRSKFPKFLQSHKRQYFVWSIWKTPNTINEGAWSDSLCDIVNRGLL